MCPCEGKSTFVLVMAWRRQATSHYLNQCWSRLSHEAFSRFWAITGHWFDIMSIKLQSWDHRNQNIAILTNLRHSLYNLVGKLRKCILTKFCYTGGTGSCYFDNFRWRHWRKFVKMTTSSIYLCQNVKLHHFTRLWAINVACWAEHVEPPQPTVFVFQRSKFTTNLSLYESFSHNIQPRGREHTVDYGLRTKNYIRYYLIDLVHKLKCRVKYGKYAAWSLLGLNSDVITANKIDHIWLSFRRPYTVIDLHENVNSTMIFLGALYWD